tara:strand:+ start:866 stop:2530 length:1665 start_codon:yes stop_codon:yes gene_type:complete
MALTTIKTGGLADNSVTDAKVANAITVTGAQTGITQVGTLTAGTWQGTPITSAYLNASQTAITSVGTLTGLSVDGGTSSLNRGNSSGDILDVRGQNTSQMKVTTTAFTVTPNATFTGNLVASTIESNKNGSDSATSGAYLRVGTASGSTNIWMWQLGASNQFDLWNYNAGGDNAWEKALTFTTTNLDATFAGQVNVASTAVINSAGSDGQLYLGGTSGSNRMYLARSGADSLLWNVSAGNLRFGTNNAERMRIDSAGKTTITSTDTTPFEVTSTGANDNYIKFRKATSGGGNLSINLIGERGAATGDIASILFANTVGGTDFTIAKIISNSTTSSGKSGNLRFFTTADSSTYVEAMTILPDGKVGIGTTSPSNLLHIEVGSLDGGGLRMSHSSGTQFMNIGCVDPGTTNDGQINVLSNNSLQFATANVLRGKFNDNSNGDFFTNDGSVSSLSDKRSKKNIVDLEDGLSIINQLKPKTFEYNGKTELGIDDGTIRYGFIADDVLEVASHYVEIGKEKIDGVEVDDFKSLSTIRMIPMMIKAIQELSAKVEALENA